MTHLATSFIASLAHESEVGIGPLFTADTFTVLNDHNTASFFIFKFTHWNCLCPEHLKVRISYFSILWQIETDLE